ncbi:hypothetical protein [Paenibacillus sp. NAIST15-1]|uniref:hypothetical protein n=1 Tax=Paenibacillus sp. NAIST15-1 TaxID=1605994 RepID=UPI000868BD1A|nr:hypothetical protein [Paenibacillus sp. NAIST15-1]GAV11848.1 hypothetical protein PBN151_1777 [Paenibacillus sp. NAIST15-1]
MYIVKASNQRHQWISGIFKEDSIPNDLKNNQIIIELPNTNYPFYIIEKENQFDFIEVEELLQRINGIETTEEENRVYFNVYVIETDFVPNKPGTDYMGIIKHEHVTNDFIGWYKRKGNSFLIQRGIL